MIVSEYASMWWLDPAVALALAVWMVLMWGDAAKEQIGLLSSKVSCVVL